MIKIAPSILSADFVKLGEDIDSVKTAELLHFDVMDGAFVPNISFGLPVLKSVRKYTDMMLVMTVEPGFGSQAFMESQIDTVREVRALLDKYNPSCDLEVDGGISEKTAAGIKAAGANVLVAGSSVFGAANRAKAIQILKTI